MRIREEGTPSIDSDDKFAPAPLAQLGDAGKREYWATLALRHCPGIGARTGSKLLKYFESALAAVENSGKWCQLGIPAACTKAIKAGTWRKGAKTEWDRAAGTDASILLWNSGFFPPILRELVDAPLLLYCSGDINLLTGPSIAVVGSRTASEYSRQIASSLASTLAGCGMTIVSGMAMGIDREAHIAALGKVGGSIGVLGSGIDVRYPACNRDLYSSMHSSGLLISEFSPGSPPSAINFPIRNRIISGISMGIVVVEAALHSGSLITARLALEQNREVFAVPGAPFSGRSEGCQNLIRQGAHPVFAVDDILRELSGALEAFKNVDLCACGKASGKNISICPPRATVAPKTPESELEISDPLAKNAVRMLAPKDKSETILEFLRHNGPSHMDAIAGALGFGAEEISTLLFSMEMLGQIKRLPGARFEAFHAR